MEKPYNYKADVYSYSILLWELYHRKSPYGELSIGKVLIEVAHKEMRPEVSHDIPRDYEELMVSCWNKESEERPDFSEILDRLKKMETVELSSLSPTDANLVSSSFYAPPKNENKLKRSVVSDIVAIPKKRKTFAKPKSVRRSKSNNADDDSTQDLGLFKEEEDPLEPDLEIGLGTLEKCRPELLPINLLVNEENKKLLLSPFSQNWQIELKDLTVGEELGRGASSVVYKGVYRGQTVAIKEFKESAKNKKQDFTKEFEILSSVRSPLVVFFFGATFAEKLCLVTEHMSRGSLLDVLNDDKVNVTMEMAVEFLHEAAVSLDALHSWVPPILHRDIKSSNFLVSQRWSVKVADFGLARFKNTSNEETLANSRIGKTANPQTLSSSL